MATRLRKNIWTVPLSSILKGMYTIFLRSNTAISMPCNSRRHPPPPRKKEVLEKNHGEKHGSHPCMIRKVHTSNFTLVTIRDPYSFSNGSLLGFFSAL